MHRWSWLVLLCAACGAKSGLKVPALPDDVSNRDASGLPDAPPFDASFDANVDACIAVGAPRRAPLDVFVLLDSSQSMRGVTGGGTSKARAVASAIEAFVTVEESAGLSIALTFFPGRPFDDLSGSDVCESTADCLAFQTCRPRGECLGSAAGKCWNSDHCVEMGGSRQCDFRLCSSTDLPCAVLGERCESGGRCMEAMACANPVLCDPDAYRRPLVPLSSLPGAITSISDAVRFRESFGNTPTTLPALTGVITQARAWSAANPGRNVVVLMATDGFSSSCDDSIVLTDPTTGLDRPAAVAREGVMDNVPTFVLGVFAPTDEDIATTNLDRLASSGGTGEAYIVSTDSDVSVSVLAVLNELRFRAQACTFSAPGGVDELVVERLEGDARERLPQVGSLSDCGETSGFYTRGGDAIIELCPSTCAAAQRPDVDIRIEGSCD